MEDNVYAIFKSEEQIIYKQILNIDEAEIFNNYLVEMINNDLADKNIGTSLVNGVRMFVEINLKLENYNYLCDRLVIVLKDYFPDLRIDHHARLYSQSYGSIKPHTDKNHDGVSNYTMLIYLTDDFDDGKLSIKTKRTHDEISEYENNKFHKVFTIKPMIGYGIIFNKNLLHWASDVYQGNKNFLLIHFHSDF